LGGSLGIFVNKQHQTEVNNNSDCEIKGRTKYRIGQWPQLEKCVSDYTTK